MMLRLLMLITSVLAWRVAAVADYALEARAALAIAIALGSRAIETKEETATRWVELKLLCWELDEVVINGTRARSAGAVRTFSVEVVNGQETIHVLVRRHGRVIYDREIDVSGRDTVTVECKPGGATRGGG